MKNWATSVKAQAGSPTLINTLLAGGYLPVVSSIGVTDEGQLMNVNADQAATALAATLGADLILLSDVSGILDGKGQRIAEMTASGAEQLIEQGHYYRRHDCESERGAGRGARAGPPGGYRFPAPCRAAAGII